MKIFGIICGLLLFAQSVCANDIIFQKWETVPRYVYHSSLRSDGRQTIITRYWIPPAYYVSIYNHGIRNVRVNQEFYYHTQINR